MSRSIALPAPVCRLIDRLETEGFDCWIVGGCVRDSLLHKTPSDWDMTTAATPEQMCAIFSDKRLMTNGEKHGTIGVIEDGQVYEITTYRVETGCSDHRHPDSVHFTSRIEEDLSRRDFTINAMAYHPQRGLLDCFGGEDDLRRRMVRCVGEPQLRFEEDALRILRALRFAAALGFLIEPQTLCAMRQKAALLQEISAERIQSELCRTLCAPSAGKVLQLAPEVWSLLLDGLSDWQTHAPSLHSLPADAVLRLCWLYGCEGRSAAPLCRKLRFSAAQIRRAESIFGCWRQLLDRKENLVFSLRKAMYRWGEAETEDTLTLLLQAQPQIPWQQELMLARQGVWKLSQLAVDGQLLMQAGCPKGPMVGQVLNRLLELCIEERLDNRRDLLLQRASELWR